MAEPSVSVLRAARRVHLHSIDCPTCRASRGGLLCPSCRHVTEGAPVSACQECGQSRCYVPYSPELGCEVGELKLCSYARAIVDDLGRQTPIRFIRRG